MPEAATENVADWPAVTVWPVGWEVIEGTPDAVMVNVTGIWIGEPVSCRAVAITFPE